MREANDPAKLFCDCDMQAAESRPIAGGRAAVFSARSPDRVTPNEDAAALIPIGADAAVLAVADGAGGERGGYQASRIAVQTLAESLGRAARDGTLLRGAILDGLERANRAVSDLGIGAATTIAAVQIENGTARPYHVGDSMILAVGQRGKIKLQTVSHSPVGFAVEAGVLDAGEAMHHEDRHLVSNVLGSPDMRIEVGSARRLAPRDTLLLASDGLFDNLHVEEIVERLRAGPLLEGARRLAWDARQRMLEPTRGFPSKLDDLTFVSFRLSS